MRVTANPDSRFLGYVQVKVASRIFTLPVEAAPLRREGGESREAGFFSDGADRFGILVDSEATDDAQRETIERASADAARHLSRKLLN